MNHSLDIAVFGASLLSAYSNSAAIHQRGLVKALAARGHRITFYEPDVSDRSKRRDIAEPPWARVVAYSATDQRDVERVLGDARRSDVIVKATSIGVWDDLLEREILGAKRTGAMVVLWDVDVGATLERLRTTTVPERLRATVPRYDVVLTRGGGPAALSAYHRLGARRCAVIDDAVDPTTHHQVPPQRRWESDLSLLANRRPETEARVDELFFGAARLVPERSFVLGGNGWEERLASANVAPNVRAAGHVYTAEHNAFNCSARAVLNVARSVTVAGGLAPSSRIFEAAAAAACIISDDREPIEALLEPGREVLLANSAADVARHLHELTPARARAIGAAARARVVTQHTFPQRAREVEAALLSVDAKHAEVSP